MNKNNTNKIYDKNFWLGLSLLIGTIVGVGIFSLPYVAIKSSFLVIACYFVAISVGVILLHHFYSEIIFYI